MPKTGDSSERHLILIGLLLFICATLLFTIQTRTKRN
ncbi:LPXTG cell wall anchor domain-containing protein [Listeria rocourtiae]